MDLIKGGESLEILLIILLRHFERAQRREIYNTNITGYVQVVKITNRFLHREKLCRNDA